jgi:hypothetical protein
LKGMLLTRKDKNNVKGLLSFFLDSYMWRKELGSRSAKESRK